MKRSAVVGPARIFTPALNYGQTGERHGYVGGIVGTLIKMLSNTDFLPRPLHTVAAREKEFVSGYNWMAHG